jgi:hypothetical protein
MATDFTVFPKLPVEIRLNTWKCGLEVGHIITIDDSTRPREQCVVDLVVECEEVSKTTEINISQSLLQVCHEARDVALKSLDAYINIRQETGEVRRLRFNSNNVVFINVFRAAALPLFMPTPQPSISSNLKNLAVHERNLYWFAQQNGDDAFVDAVVKLPSLETLIVVTSQTNERLHINSNTKFIELSILHDLMRRGLSGDHTGHRFANVHQMARKQKCLVSYSSRSSITIMEFLKPFKQYKMENPQWKVPKFRIMAVSNPKQHHGVAGIIQDNGFEIRLPWNQRVTKPVKDNIRVAVEATLREDSISEMQAALYKFTYGNREEMLKKAERELERAKTKVKHKFWSDEVMKCETLLRSLKKSCDATVVGWKEEDRKYEEARGEEERLLNLEFAVNGWDFADYEQLFG